MQRSTRFKLKAEHMATLTWTDTEVFRLLDIWGEDNTQEQLEGSKRNKHVYDRMSEELRVYGIQKNGEQVRCKVKKLRQEYKKIKDGHKETGNKRKQWKYYDKINEIMGNRPSVTPPVILDTLQDTAGPSTSYVENTSDEDVKGNEEDEKEITDDNGGEEEGKDEFGKKTGSTVGVKGKGKKRKHTKAEVMEDMMTKAMKTMTDGLKESEKMFVDLEENT